MDPTTQDGASQPKKDFHCEMCNVNCLSAVSFQAHTRGAKHMKVMRANKDSDLVLIPPKKFNSLKDFISDPDRDEPLIGLKYVEEGRKLKGKRHYRCTLCNIDMAMQIMFDHLIGHKHRRTYLNKHFPLLIKGVQTPSVAVLKTLAKEVEDEEGLQTYETNVAITLKPQPSVKKPAENASQQQPAPETNPIRAKLTTADDIIEKLGHKPEFTEQFSSSRDTENPSKRRMDNSPHRYTNPESTAKYQSSRDTEPQSKRYRDRSPPQYKKPEMTAKPYSSYDADYHTKRHIDPSPPHYKNPEKTSGYSSSRDAENLYQRHRDYSPHEYQNPERTSQHPSSSDAEHLSQRYRDNPHPQYKNPERTSQHPSSSDAEHLSQRYRDDCPPQYKNPEMTSQHPSSSDAEHLSQRYRDDTPPQYKSTTPFKSTHRQGNALDYLQSFEITSDAEASIVASLTQHLIKHLATYTGTKEIAPQVKPAEQHVSEKIYETGHHSGSGYNKKDEEHQRSSEMASYQQDSEPSKTTSINSAGLSPDILNILRGKDVPTVTSILNRLSQYYPPLQNVDISLLVSVLFESGALQ